MLPLGRMFSAIAMGILAGAPADQIGAQPPVAAQPSAAPFSPELVQQLARDLASKPFEPPSDKLPAGLDALDYDQFRQIRFRSERTIWRGDGLEFQLQVLPTGWLFKSPVEIALVDQDRVEDLRPDTGYFDMGPLSGKLLPEARPGFSGFRLLGPLNRPDRFDELVVFQGASYFRALSRGQSYGLSARALALDVGNPGGEEFPMLRRFWIEKPAKLSRQIVVHALLDSASVAGAYRFVIEPGEITTMNVELTLYPRKDLTDVGIAPLTSMFLFSSVDRTRISDFRPAVHDSDGLGIRNGSGEEIWRPLSNPRLLQTSDFLDSDPRGFGLIQRARDFASFEDLEAHYERRPSAWVEPLDGWGLGAVRLFEIPTEEEIHDNIVAYWKPAKTLAAGRAQSFRYRLTWPDDMPRPRPLATVAATRAGLINGPQRQAGIYNFIVDFRGYADAAELPSARVQASAGAAGPPVVQANPYSKGLRVSFSFDPEGATSSELRLTLSADETPISEVWLYRWTKD